MNLPEPGPLRDELLHEFFEASADRSPERTAVEFGGVRLSYRELEERANRLARVLRARGIGREDRVAILLPRGERVYEALLGVLKAGAAYVPIDPAAPPDRAALIAADSGAKCMITLASLDADADALAAASPARLPRAGTTPADLCYVIYTSGTTGRPKGVQIEHRNATFLVRAESALYGAREGDRVFQFFSAAFDASVEEIWLAFFHGAALVCAPVGALRAGPEFCAELTRLGVTILSCVPTFLMMLEKDLPTVRVLILGGETCPDDVAKRWCRPGRTVFNTYGPTETTVIATAAVLSPDRPATIGRPVPGYEIFLLDENLRPVRDGGEGELCVGGPGVARGYLNRPELQAEKFVVAETAPGRSVRLYRTGDLARLNADGELLYLGRADDQVKIRGYRVELSEIETTLVKCPGVLAAAASLQRDSQRIAAYVVPRSGASADRAALRALLVASLPPYMVPAFLDEVEALPMTASGKIDRRRLPAPKLALGGEGGARVAPRDEAERAVAAVWASVLGRDGLSMLDDFFADLGGHSMLAAQATSRLRAAPGFESVSIGDLYAHPTAEALARLIKGPAAPRRGPEFRRASTTAYLACAAGQALGVLFLAGVYAWQWLGAFLTYGYLVVDDWPVRHALLVALAVNLVTTPLVLALSIAVKWLLLGRIKEGRHPLWGWYYWRFWFVRALVRAAPVSYLAGTPLLNLYYSLMGARIGDGVFIGGDGLTTFDLLSVGDGSSLGADVNVDGASVENGMLRLASVTIGRGCWVGHRCSLGAGAALEDGAGLGDLSMLPDGARVPAGELWKGSPAIPAGRLEPAAARAPWAPSSWLAHLAGVFLFPLVILAAIFPGLMLITQLGHWDEGYRFLVYAPLVALSFVVFLCVEILVSKRLLFGRERETRYPVGGSFYVRKWFFDQLMNLSLEVTGTLYTTLYLQPWLRAMGARIGPRSEISTIRFIDPDQLEAGAECFLADDALIGAASVRGGWAESAPARVGERTFVGNSAVLPAGARLGDGVLLGVLTLAAPSVPGGTAWFGSPPIRLPARQGHGVFSEDVIYRPSRRLVALRLFIEFFRVILPSTIFVVLAALIMNATDILQDYIGLGQWLLLLPVMYVAAGTLAVAATALLKGLLVGRYRRGEWPLWCDFVWRTELVTGLYENLSVLFFIDLLRGTPFIIWVLRALGMRAGRRCYVDTTWFTEFDLIELGDEAALNDNANVQTHLFEDRIFKTGPVRIGARASVGAMSTVLYDAELGEGAALGDLSLLMKGETLPAGTRWRGLPARRAD